MKLLFKQRFFSWFDSYDIYDEAGNTVYTVEGKLAWGHCLHILDAAGNHIGTVQQKVLTFLPKFELSMTNASAASRRSSHSFHRALISTATAGRCRAASWSGTIR